MSQTTQLLQTSGEGSSETAKPVAKLLLIDGGNFDNFPSGGILTDLRHVVKAFGSQVAAVGAEVPGCPIGRWTERDLCGHRIQYFSFWKTPQRPNDRPIIPRRMQVLFRLPRFRARIQESGIETAYVSSHEVLIAVQSWKFKHLIYRFPGLSNPFSISRYRWARTFDWIFRPIMNRALLSASHILATADDATVRSFIDEFAENRWIERVSQGTTFFDEDCFHPEPKASARVKLGICGSPVLVSLGRLNRDKGWPLLLTAFCQFRRVHHEATLYFVGEGEDRDELLEFATSLGVGSSIFMAGRVDSKTVSTFLNSADLMVSCSEVEGWPTAIVESLACGVPVVSTRVSGVDSLIVDGGTGFVVETRDPADVCAAMERCISLRGYEEVCLHLSERYNLYALKKRLKSLVPELA